MAGKLTPKQRRFALEYLVDLNATRAAIRAKYTARNADVVGPRLLGNVGVKRFIDESLAKREKRTEIKADEVLRELKRLAFSDVRQLIGPDDQLTPLRELPDELAAAVSSVEIESLFRGRGKKQSRAGKVLKVKLWSKPDALQMLGRHLRLFTDVLELKDGELTDEERAKRIAVLIEKARARKKEAERKKGT